MLDEQTHQKLMTMKMYGLAADFQIHLDGQGDEGLSFEERFGLMVDREWSERQERKLKLRLSRAKLRERACLEDIDYRHPRGLDRSVIKRLALCRWVNEAENIILTGPTGVGKTWIACALTDNACRQGHTARYARVPRLLHELAIAQADGTYARALNRLAKTEVLILDDWGLAPLEDRERRDMLEIIEDRNGRRSTIVTSQLPIKKWHDHIGDPTIADSIMDRLVHNAHRLELKGSSLRKRRSGKQKMK
jgi:DNA replication protein DnaC